MMLLIYLLPIIFCTNKINNFDSKQNIEDFNDKKFNNNFSTIKILDSENSTQICRINTIVSICSRIEKNSKTNLSCEFLNDNISTQLYLCNDCFNNAKIINHFLITKNNDCNMKKFVFPKIYNNKWFYIKFFISKPNKYDSKKGFLCSKVDEKEYAIIYSDEGVKAIELNHLNPLNINFDFLIIEINEIFEKNSSKNIKLFFRNINNVNFKIPKIGYWKFEDLLEEKPLKNYLDKIEAHGIEGMAKEFIEENLIKKPCVEVNLEEEAKSKAEKEWKKYENKMLDELGREQFILLKPKTWVPQTTFKRILFCSGISLIICIFTNFIISMTNSKSK